MKTSTNFSPEGTKRAFRMAREHQSEHESQWAAIGSIATKIGCTAETLRHWVRQAEKDNGERDGLTTASVSGFLRKASVYFALAELGRPLQQ